MFLRICIDNETGLLNFCSEAKNVFGIRSKNFLTIEDIAVAKVTTKVWILLTEFLEELSSERLHHSLSFFYVPHLFNLKEVAEECISDLEGTTLEVDLSPILKRIEKQLFAKAKDYKAIFVAGALHFSKGSDVIVCYEKLTGEKLEVIKELSTTAAKLYNSSFLIDRIPPSDCKFSSEQISTFKKTFQKTIQQVLGNDYNNWKSRISEYHSITSKENKIFKSKRIKVEYESTKNQPHYTYCRNERNVSGGLDSPLFSAEILSCDNIIVEIYLSRLLEVKVGPTEICKDGGNTFAACIKYFSSLNVNSITRFSSLITDLNTQDRLSRAEKICRLKILLENDDSAYSGYPQYFPIRLLRNFPCV